MIENVFLDFVKAQTEKATETLVKDVSALPVGSTHLLVLGHRVQQLHVQFGVVLSQRLVPIMVYELHHRAEGQRVGETVLPLAVEDRSLSAYYSLLSCRRIKKHLYYQVSVGSAPTSAAVEDSTVFSDSNVRL